MMLHAREDLAIFTCTTSWLLQEWMLSLRAAISIWDIAAITVIVREAGGKVTDIQGQPITRALFGMSRVQSSVTDIQGQPITKETASLVATNGVLHNTVLDYFKDASS